MGYTIAYQKPYDTATSQDDIENTKRQCGYLTTLCVGGGRFESDSLDVVACANCLKITTETSRDSPNLVNSNYWYYSPGLSFGFSHSSTITQQPYDTNDLNDNSRLSWSLDNEDKSRLGVIFPESNFNKYIFIKDPLKIECPQNWTAGNRFNCALLISSENQFKIIKLEFDDGTTDYFETTDSIINFSKAFNLDGVHIIKAYVSIYDRWITQTISILKRKSYFEFRK